MINSKNFPLLFYTIIISVIFIISGCNQSQENESGTDRLRIMQIDKTLLMSTSTYYRNEDNSTMHFNGLSVDIKGNIFTFDWYSGKVLKINSDGAIVSRTGGLGDGPNEYNLEMSAAGLDLCGNSRLVVHDMNKPVVNIYDTDLRFLYEISVNGPVWSVSCNDEEVFMVLYRHNNTFEMFDMDGQALKRFQIAGEDFDPFTNLKHFFFNNDTLYAVYATKNIFLITDLEGNKITSVNFKTVEEDESKPATIRTLRLFNYNDMIQILTVMDNGRAVHSFNMEGEYLYTIPVETDVGNVYQNQKNLLYVLGDANESIKKYRINRSDLNEP